MHRQQDIRQRRRVMKRVAEIVPDDLLQFCVMKGLASQRAASESVGSGSAEPAGLVVPDAAVLTKAKGAGSMSVDRDPE